MWTANQALNGLIGTGMPQDWATHMIGHQLTALWHVDHARSLAIVQPSLLRSQMEFKKEKIEQMGRNVFGLTSSDDLAERTVDAIEAFYIKLNVDTCLSEVQGDKSEAVDAVIKKLEDNGYLKLGENQAITIDVSRHILENAL
jgi:NADP-dependent alcohol dehydrogenase